MAQAELMRAFQFDTSDLDANQRGLLTQRQRERLRQAIYAPFTQLNSLARQLLVWFMLPALIMYLYFYIAYPEDRLRMLLILTITLCALMMFLFLVLLIRASVMALFRARAIMADIRNGTIRLINGKIVLDQKKVSILRGVSFDEYHLKIDGLDFIISGRESAALGKYVNYSYRVYFVPTSNIILSVEQI